MDSEPVQLARGGDGRRIDELLEGLLLPSFSSQQLLARQDGAVLNIAVARPAFTTDSYVVKPLFFPGGDIGRLAVNGTLKDLALCGARPLYRFCFRARNGASVIDSPEAFRQWGWESVRFVRSRAA